MNNITKNNTTPVSPWTIVRSWHAVCFKCDRRIRKYTEGTASIPSIPNGWEIIEDKWYCKTCVKKKNALKIYVSEI